jgi:wee1-like protein kinase
VSDVILYLGYVDRTTKIRFSRVSAWKEVCAHAVLVKHNHIVQYYSAWAEADRMLIQNEYCNGGSLAEHIEKNRMIGHLMNETDLKLLLLHTAKGLAYMHSLNLVHLDIKPGRVL